MTKRTLSGLTALVAAGMVAIAFAASPDPIMGTWTLNVGKSKFGTGPVLKSQTRTYSMSGDTISLSMKSTTADGKEATMTTTYKLDGKDYPVTGSPDWDSLSGRQVDANTAEFTLKRAGKSVGMTSRMVSKDGKTMTSKQSTTNSKGEKVEAELVFDKK